MKENRVLTRTDKINLAADIIVAIGYLLLIAGIGMFLGMNEGIFFSTAAMSVIFAIVLLIMPVGYVLFRKKRTEGKVATGISAGAVAAAVLMLVILILFSLVVDFVQPLMLNTATCIILIAASVIMLAGAAMQIFGKRHVMTLVVCVLLIVAMLVGVIWFNAQGFRDFNDEVMTDRTFLFANGEDGYATFRIPSLVTLDKDVLNEKYGTEFERDVLLASAEGRVNSAHDTGSIDLVYKTSADGGKTWSELRVLLSYDDEVGKYGNPTPVLDRETGLVVFPYMSATKADKYDYQTFVARYTVDQNAVLTINEEPINISFEKTDGGSGGADGVRQHTLMIGPGKSIQLENGEHKGRLIIPASSGGETFVLYSDDHGANWNVGESAGTGNECEAAELPDGELVMVVRDMTGCSAIHPEQYQRLSYSCDGGQTWYRKTEDTTLRSPICMSSLTVTQSGALVMSYPDSFDTRVNLTVGVSTDRGESWQTYGLYNGASGYSCLTSDSNGNLYVLAEVGKVNYNDALMFAVLNLPQA